METKILLKKGRKTIYRTFGTLFFAITVFSIPMLKQEQIVGNIEPEIAGVSVQAEVNPTPPPPAPLYEKKTFGNSVTGRPIEGYVFGSGGHALLLHASLHGNEMGTTDLLNRFIEELKSNPAMVATTTKLLIIPIANPDGYYDRTDKLNANGVNLNLNFKTAEWSKYGPGGTFGGTEPFTEIESNVLRQVVEEYKPEAMIAFHAKGAIVSPESIKASAALAKWYAKKTGYEYYPYWDFAGTATRWFEETYNKPAITIELTTMLGSDWAINKKALLELATKDIFEIIPQN